MSSTVVECTKEVFAFFHGHNGEITDNVQQVEYFCCCFCFVIKSTEMIDKIIA